MADKTARERFDEAVNALKTLESEGYDCGPVRRLSLSATGAVKPPAPVTKSPPKPFSALAKNKDEAKS